VNAVAPGVGSLRHRLLKAHSRGVPCARSRLFGTIAASKDIAEAVFYLTDSHPGDRRGFACRWRHASAANGSSSCALGPCRETLNGRRLCRSRRFSIPPHAKATGGRDAVVQCPRMESWTSARETHAELGGSGSPGRTLSSYLRPATPRVFIGANEICSPRETRIDFAGPNYRSRPVWASAPYRTDLASRSH